MNRREFLKSGAAALALGLSGCAGTVRRSGRSSGKPNIILCMTDDQGWGDVSYNGLKQIQTRTLDAMAAEGMRFNRFYSAHPSCSPIFAASSPDRLPFAYSM